MTEKEAPPPTYEQAAAAPGGPVIAAVAAAPAKFSTSTTLLYSPITRTATAYVSVQPPPNSETRTPVDIVCVVDISGSMQEEVHVHGGESDGFSRLDLVKHAIRAILHSMNEHDRFALVTFSSSAIVQTTLTETTDHKKPLLLKALDTLTPDGGTNLWGGIQTGMELFKGEKRVALRKVLVFTDGQPNVPPPLFTDDASGYRLMMLHFKKANPDISCSLDLFGFDYKLNVDVLTTLAREGRGSYAFIPDASMLGTIFIHSMANAYASACQSYRVATSAFFGSATEYHPPLQYGQCGDFVVKLEKVSFDELGKIEILADVILFDGTRERLDAMEHAFIPLQNKESAYVIYQQCKQRFLKTIAEGDEDLELTAKFCTSAFNSEAMKKEEERKDAVTAKALLQGLVKDLQGQVAEAFGSKDKKAYARWGRLFLPSLAFAHRLQQCNNFKDFGVQLYGGELFKSLRAELGLAWCKVPAPVPTYGGKRAKTVEMSAYHNADGGCFSQDSVLRMADGSDKLACEVQAGDLLWPRVRVRCVVTSAAARKAQVMVRVDTDLCLTPFHPILHEGVWIFPCAHPRAKRVYTRERVYNLVTEGGAHVTSRSGVTCCTLGHGYLEDPVLSHEYFGTDHVLRDLEKMPGWSTGRVDLDGVDYLRDSVRGRVCGLSR